METIFELSRQLGFELIHYAHVANFVVEVVYILVLDVCFN